MLIQKIGRCRIKWSTFDLLHSRLITPSRQNLATGNQTGSMREREIRPCPLKEDSNAIAKTDKKVNVNRQPRHPRHEAAPMCLERPLDFGDSGKTANRSHVTFVKVAKRLAWLVLQILRDHVGNMLAHLHCGLRDARYLLTILFDVREIATDEYFRMPRGVQGFIHHHGAFFIDLNSKQFAQRRSLYPCCPQRHNCIQPTFTHHHISRLHIRDLSTRVHFYSEIVKLLNSL